jgi:HD-like signal output (HDOD) protein
MVQWLLQLFSGPAKSEPQGAPAPAATDAESAAAGMPIADAAESAAAPAVAFDQLDRVNGLYNRWLFDTEAESDFDINPLEAEVLEALAAIVNSQQSGSALVRRMPGMIPQLLQSLRSDTFSGAQLSRTISSDVVLVAAVIRLANSSLKGSGKSISSVEHAVMLIGQEGLRHLITSVAFRPIIDMRSGYFTRTLAPRIWDHSERCAMANRALAEAMGTDPFEAFLAGLVQNVGLIVSLRIMDQIAQGDRNLGSEMFCAHLMRDARRLTCSIGREWHFPESVTQAIGAQGGIRKGTAVASLGCLLTLTDYLGKLRILVENERACAGDPALFGGLPPFADAAYSSFQPIDTPMPAGASSRP